MSLTLFSTLLFLIFTATITTTVTTTTTSPENLIPSLKSKNITSVQLISPNPELISLFSNTNISVLLSIPNALIPSFSSNSSATSAWLSTHVTPFLHHVRISAISVGNDVTDTNLLKLVVTAIDNVKDYVMDLGLNVSITVSFSFVTGTSESVVEGLLSSLGEKGVTSLFVSTGNRNVSLGSSFKEVVCGDFVLKRDLSTDGCYDSLGVDDESVVAMRVLKVEGDKVMSCLDTVNNIVRIILRIILCIVIYVMILLHRVIRRYMTESRLLGPHSWRH